jgi:enoyl-CoA hydratase/carnithine racemase
MPELRVDEHVYELDLGDGENRFTPSWIADVGAALGEVANGDGPRALVTVAAGKHWSNGLDLEWLGTHPGELEPYVATVHGLYAQLLALPVPSIAVLQGHAYAAGAMLSLAHDVRIQRADRGYWCLPEVNLGIPFTPGMAALIQAKLAPPIAHEVMTTGRRYAGADAQAKGIVDVALPEAAMLDHARAVATELAPTAGPTLAAIRTEMYRSVLRLLTDDGAALS